MKLSNKPLFGMLISLFTLTASYAHASTFLDELMNPFHELKVSPGIYRGSYPFPDDMAQLTQVGIRTDIDLEGGDLSTPVLGDFSAIVEFGETSAGIAQEESLMSNAGIQFVHLPLNSVESIDATEAAEIQQALKIMNTPSLQPVYVHCSHGKDRTGLVVALYRVFYEGWTPEAAYQEMLQLGHSGILHQIFTGAMDRYFFEATGWQPSSSDN